MALQKFFRLLLVGAALCAGSARADLVVQQYEADRHDRFTNSSEFLGSAYDWSGIGRRAGGGRWATLISPSYFLSAFHFRPGLASTVRFYASNSLSGAFEDRVVMSGEQIDGSDLWLGKLSNPVSGVIDPFPILAPANLTNQEIFVFGQSGPTGMRLGRNLIDGVLTDFQDDGLGTSHGDVFLFDYDTANGLGQDESQVQSGDSGGPSFAIVDGKPAILGIHWFNFTSSGGLGGSGDTLVSSFVTELMSATAGESLTLVAIPEPAAVWLFSLIAALTTIKSKIYCRRSRAVAAEQGLS